MSDKKKETEASGAGKDENRMQIEGRVLPVRRGGEFCYPIRLEQDFGKLSQSVGELGTENRKICIVTDSHVGPLYVEAVREQLAAVCGRVTVYTIEAGEEHKTLDTVKGLYEHLILEHYDRKDMLAALGGGVIGDLTGFAAATYLRGIGFIQIPTTLLAQVDSSIGGKTGVDFDSYKNMVGAFHMPRLVYMNLSVLKTLPDHQFSSGMAEILKHGLIKNADYFDWLSAHRQEILERRMEALMPMIEESCRIKRDVVEKDPTEQGERALLNFGHTIGHAVEKLKNFRLSHGECVAVGSAAASYLSWKRGLIDRETLDRICQVFQSFSLPVRTDGLDPARVLAATKSDKKMDGGSIKFILLRKPGEAFVDRTVSEAELLDAITWITED